MSPDNFFSDLSIYFSKVTSEFDPDEGTHFKMERFVDYTIEQIKQNNMEELKKCFDFIEFRLDSIAPEIENALNVSYCEALIFFDDDKRGMEMKKTMPEKLLRFYLDYKNYYNSLYNSH